MGGIIEGNMTKEEMIKELINQDFEDIQQELCETGGCAFLYDILVSGWKGYDEMPDKELKREYDDRYQSF